MSVRVGRLVERPRFGACDRLAVVQMLDTAQGIAEEEFLPVAALVDANRPRFDNGRAVVPLETGEMLSRASAQGRPCLVTSRVSSIGLDAVPKPKPGLRMYPVDPFPPVTSILLALRSRRSR